MRQREKELNKNSKERIKIVETGGIKIENILTNKNPFKNEPCDQKWCPLCKFSTKISCNTNNVGYSWTCKTCEGRNILKIYEGESSRSARIRGKEHLTAYKNQKSDSVLYKHKISDHGNENVEYEMKISGIFKDPLTRQANEAVRIFSRKISEILNSKSEFNHPSVARVVVENRK